MRILDFIFSVKLFEGSLLLFTSTCSALSIFLILHLSPGCLYIVRNREFIEAGSHDPLNLSQANVHNSYASDYIVLQLWHLQTIHLLAFLLHLSPSLLTTNPFLTLIITLTHHIMTDTEALNREEKQADLDSSPATIDVMSIDPTKTDPTFLLTDRKSVVKKTDLTDNDEILARLIQMGFDFTAAEHAVRKTKDDGFNAALQFLMQQQQKGVVDDEHSEKDGKDPNNG